jgi:hypothetical protein
MFVYSVYIFLFTQINLAWYFFIFTPRNSLIEILRKKPAGTQGGPCLGGRPGSSPDGSELREVKNGLGLEIQESIFTSRLQYPCSKRKLRILCWTRNKERDRERVTDNPNSYFLLCLLPALWSKFCYFDDFCVGRGEINSCKCTQSETLSTTTKKQTVLCFEK